MKKPNPKNLKLNNAKTKRIRTAMSKSKSVKITINIDSDTLLKLKTLAEESGVPYQRLLNRTLAEGLFATTTLESRIKRLERELKELKKKLDA